MQNLKLTIQEAQELLLMSQSSVYSWIDKGKLQSIDSPTGKIVVISNTEANQIRELNLKSRRNRTSKQSTVINNSTQSSQEFSDTLQENIEIDTENNASQNQQDLTGRLISELKELALEAGRYKQLEIIRNEEKENVKYWEEKFFEANHALQEKNLEIIALNKQITELQAQLEKAHKKTWFTWK